MTRNGSFRCVVCSVVLVCVTMVAAESLDRAFVYQGHLQDDGAAADGLYDFQFSLYDDAAAGNQIGSTVTVNDHQVSDGVCTVELDFGDVYNGQQLWLQVAVRDGADSGPYSALSPRQKLSAAPYAQYSMKPWSQTDTGVCYPDGSVSVGTSTPANGSVLTLAAAAPDFGNGMIHQGFGTYFDGIHRLLTLRKPNSTGDGSLDWTLESDGGDTPRLYFQRVNRPDGGSNSFVTPLSLSWSGNVGIGTDTPGDFPLTFTDAVGDKISLFGQTGNHYGFGIQPSLLQIYTSSSVADVAFGYGTSGSFAEKVRITGDGKIGIGTTNPLFSLHSVAMSNAILIESTTGSAGLQLSSNGTGTVEIWSPGNTDDMRFYLNGADRMTITPAGDVGIGTTSPGGQLHVVDPAGNTKAVYGQATSSQYTNYGGYFTGTGTYGYGVYGEGSRWGVSGKASGAYPASGVYGESPATGVHGKATGGSTMYGVYGESIGNGVSYGVYGTTSGATSGTHYGVYGTTSGGGYQYAGGFSGKVTITENLYVGGGISLDAGSPTEKIDADGTARLRDMPYSTGTTVVVDSNGVLSRLGSSLRYKKDIAPLDVAGLAIMKLQPVRFRYKGSDVEDIGLIAEDVARVAEDLVIYDDQGRPDAVKYDRLALYLLDVVKFQQERIGCLEAEHNELIELRSRLDTLEQLVTRSLATQE